MGKWRTLWKGGRGKRLQEGTWVQKGGEGRGREQAAEESESQGEEA